MQVRRQIVFPALLGLGLGLAPAWSISATDELPDDEFLEFLGVWDEAWTEVCEPQDGQPDDDTCLEYDDDEQENIDNEN